MAKPGGTRTPAADKARYISPREAFLPPTSGMSSRPSSANQRIEAIWGAGNGMQFLLPRLPSCILSLHRSNLRATSPSGCGSIGTARRNNRSIRSLGGVAGAEGLVIRKGHGDNLSGQCTECHHQALPQNRQRKQVPHSLWSCWYDQHGTGCLAEHALGDTAHQETG